MTLLGGWGEWPPPGDAPGGGDSQPAHCHGLVGMSGINLEVLPFQVQAGGSQGSSALVQAREAFENFLPLAWKGRRFQQSNALVRGLRKRDWPLGTPA